MKFFYRLFVLFLAFVASPLHAQQPVQSWGQLRIEGPDIVNQFGDQVQLQGMSLFWSQWEGEFYEYNTIKWLRDDWKCNIVRAACGVEDNGSPFYGMEFQLNKARAVIDAALELDIYVLVDWHAHYASWNTPAAKEFFRTIAQEYGQHPNIIYEVFNEPIDYGWPDIKSYAEEVIAEIRQYDADNIIVVGTPSYSAYPDAVVGNAINSSNIAYTLHYYAASHFQNYRNRANWARANGHCVFVTEYGLVNFDGDGAVNEDSSRDWWNWMKDNKISHCNWSIADKNEGSAALTPGTPAGGFWGDHQLTWSGGLVREWLRNNSPDYNINSDRVTPIPARLEAELYNNSQGIQVETTEDTDGGLNVGYIDDGDWIEYQINASGTGNYDVTYRLASPDGGSFRMLIDGVEAHTVTVPATGGWQAWEPVEKTLDLNAGEHTIRIEVLRGGWNLNYIDILGAGLADCNGDVEGGALMDNCGVCSGGLTGIAVNACEGGCNTGLSPYGLKDEFIYPTDPYNENGGIYVWGEATLEDDPNPEFQAIINRNSDESRLEVQISQGQGDYIPFGFSLGDEPENIMDLSGDASFEFILENPTNTSVNMSIAIQDVNGNIVNTSADANGEPFADAWMYGFEADIIGGATYTFRGDFTGGFESNYTSEAFESNLDFTKVKTILITIVNAENTGAPSYEPLPLEGAMLHLLEMRIGDCGQAYSLNNRDCNGDLGGDAFWDNCGECAGGNTGIEPNTCVNGTEEYRENASLKAFPNPSNGLVTLSESVNWALYNQLGHQIKAGESKEVDMSQLMTGVYMLKTEKARIVLIRE